MYISTHWTGVNGHYPLQREIFRSPSRDDLVIVRLQPLIWGQSNWQVPVDVTPSAVSAYLFHSFYQWIFLRRYTWSLLLQLFGTSHHFHTLCSGRKAELEREALKCNSQWHCSSVGAQNNGKGLINLTPNLSSNYKPVSAICGAIKTFLAKKEWITTFL